MAGQGWRGAIVKVVEGDDDNGALRLLLSDHTIHFGEQVDTPAPELPYLVFTDEGEAPEYMGLGVKETHNVLFIFFASSLAQAEDVELALKGLFDPAGGGKQLPISNGQVSGAGKFVSGGTITKVRHPQRTSQGAWLYKGVYPYVTIINR